MTDIVTLPESTAPITATTTMQLKVLLLVARGSRHTVCFLDNKIPTSPIPLQNDYCLDLDGCIINYTVTQRPTVGTYATIVLKFIDVKPSLIGIQPKYVAFVNDVGVGKSSIIEFSDFVLRSILPLKISSPSYTQLIASAVNATNAASDNYWLTPTRAEGDLQSPKDMKSNPYPKAVLSTGLTVSDLTHGKRYIFLYEPYVSSVIDKLAFDVFYGIGIVTCSCPDSNGTYPTDQTGKPINLSVIQKNGFVSMNFTDNSECEEAYSFTRQKIGFPTIISYASNYYFYSQSKCGNNLFPGQSYADDLSMSLLDVESTFTYCSQAVAPNYVADAKSTTAYRMSSDSSCQDVTISWEASVQGLITSKSSAGSVPI